MKTINGIEIIATQEEINKAVEQLGEEFTESELNTFLALYRSTKLEKDLIEQFESILTNYMNSKAKERGYDSIHTASLRAALPASPFHAEGIAYGTWMDDCNSFAYALLAEIKAGNAPIPTEQKFITMLPVLELP